jgi:hypothetical protein
MEISNSTWGVYKNLIDSFANSVNKEEVEWLTKSFKKGRYGEGNSNGYSTVTIEALIQFNVFRTWPITKHSPVGESDHQNMALILNREYLSTNGWLTADGQFNFKPEEDLFKHRGITYKCEGTTLSSQAKNDPLHVWVILLRQDQDSGS